MSSIIRQSANPLRAPYREAMRLPDFRNLGVVLRILVVGNGLGMVAALLKSPDAGGFGAAWLEVASVLEPVLLGHVLLLGAAGPMLSRFSYARGVAGVLLLTAVLVTLVAGLERQLIEGAHPTWLRYLALGVLGSGFMLFYFNLRSRALSPALTEARLAALQAKIRPHFLFNAINAVLSLVRDEPRRAEAALEDMADLFRALMADNRDLAPLADEVELCRQYLNLEKLRLGDRLQVEWFIDKMPGDALVPPLCLQPLVENAVYHGVQRSPTGGTISINIFQRRNEVHAVLSNPYHQEGTAHAGNRMALDNIRERLALHFDAEASLTTKIAGNAFQVHIRMPYRRAGGNDDSSGT